MAQIVDWLGRGFDGVIVFDEAHAMANAAGEKSVHGAKKPSLPGQAGLRLQNAVPDARVVYVSATGATRVANLAYASRLGLWQTGDFPFASRTDFIAAMEAGHRRDGDGLPRPDGAPASTPAASSTGLLGRVDE